MATTIRMKHKFFAHDWTEYFYDGELKVTDGHIEVPVERPEWAQRLWILGFQEDFDGQPIEDIFAHMQREQARDAKEIDASEGADAGRQPDDQDGVRTGSTQSRRGIPRGRLASRKRNSARTRA